MAASQQFSAAALQLRRDSLLTEARYSSASNAAGRKSNSFATPEAQPPLGDAVIVTLSARARANADGLGAASRNVSRGNALLQAGENATNKIDALVTKLKSLTQASEGKLLDPTTSAAREIEGDDLVGEIDSIVSNASYNGSLVVNAGDIAVGYELDGGDANSANELRLTVANIGLSAAQLGLDDLSGASFTDSTQISDTLDALEVASRITANTGATINNSRGRISSFAQAIGSVAGTEAELPSNGIANTGESAAAVKAQAAKTVSDSAKAPELVRVDLLLESLTQDEAIRRTTVERSTGESSSAASSSGGFSAVA